MCALDCGHYFCFECMTQYAENKVVSGKVQGYGVGCPGVSCHIAIDEQLIQQLVDPSLYARYTELKTATNDFDKAKQLGLQAA